MSVKLLFVGDFCTKTPENIKMSSELVELIKNNDIACINFEMTLAKGNLQSANGHKLEQSHESPKWIKENGFNLISLANNHMNDYGVNGIKLTLDAFNDTNVVGAGTWDKAYQVKFIQVKGLKIGIFSATSSDFASLKDVWEDKNKTGCAWINHYKVNTIISSAKKECDYLFVLSHGGVEFMDVPLPEWRDRYRELIDIGVDAVIGSHPHVPQGVENYKGKPIFYSLGNFFFDKENSVTPKFWDNGLVALIEIVDGKILYKYVPILKKGNELMIDDSTMINNHLSDLNEMLKDDKEYIKVVNREVLRLSEKYTDWLLFGIGAFRINLSLKNILRIIKNIVFNGRNEKVFLHQIREESTRWLLMRAYKIKTKTDL